LAGEEIKGLTRGCLIPRGARRYMEGGSVELPCTRALTVLIVSVLSSIIWMGGLMYPIVGGSASHGGRCSSGPKEMSCLVVDLCLASPWGDKRE
jgi:hypothetical protein